VLFHILQLYDTTLALSRWACVRRFQIDVTKKDSGLGLYVLFVTILVISSTVVDVDDDVK